MSKKNLKTNSWLKRTAYIVSTLLIVFLFIKYISSNWEDLKNIQIVHPHYIVVMLIFSLINIFAFGRGMDAVLTPFKINLSILQTFKIASLTRVLNQLVPGRAGIAARAQYFKTTHKLPYAKYISSFFASTLIMYFISSLIGVTALLFLPREKQSSSLGLILMALLIFLLVIFVFKPKPRDPTHRNKLIRHINRAIEGWIQIRKDKRSLYITFFWMTANVLSQILVFWSSFKALGVDVNFWGAAFVSAITLLSTFINLTPGSLGIAEAFAVAASVSINIAAPVAFAAALLRRFSDVSIAGITALFTIKIK